MSLRSAAAAVAFVGLPVAVIGWHLGFQSLVGDALLLAVGLSVADSAWRLTRRFFAPLDFVDAVVRAGVVAFALVTTVGLVLGSIGQIGVWAYAIGIGAIAVATSVLARGGARFLAPDWRSAPPIVLALLGALFVLALAFAATHAPSTLYDSVSYHLFFAARWLQDHRISIVPTPFSDPAQAYAPGNGELYLMWLMLPLHGDLVARVGELPFALLAAATVFALARRLGATNRHAAYTAAFLLMSRAVFEQAIGANVDVICAASFFAAIYLGVVAVDRDGRSDWLLWGIAAGLALGTKYLGLVYLPVLLVLPIVRGLRVKAVWALAGVAAFALPWYLRNWIVAGSPIYPASLAVAGRTIASGAFSHAAMTNTIFHTDRLALFPVVIAYGAGPLLALVIAVFFGWGLIQLMRRGWWPHAFVALLPLAMLPLFWFGLPVNIDARFLLPALLPAFVTVAFVFGRSRRANTAIETMLSLALLAVLIGSSATLSPPRHAPWFMQTWLDLTGLVGPPYVPLMAGLALAIGAIWRLGAWRSGLAAVALGAVGAAAVAILAIGGDVWCRPYRCEYVHVSDPSIRTELQLSWSWMDEHVAHATVAYTGINLPYPLAGPDLTNRVVYVNIDGHPAWRLHDYDRAFRSGAFQPQPPLLAVRSGELEPALPDPGPGDDAIRPRYERMQGFRDLWLRNLSLVRATYLYVSQLSAYERDYQWHTPDVFPIEDEWARTDPEVFHLEYENDRVRIYTVRLRP